MKFHLLTRATVACIAGLLVSLAGCGEISRGTQCCSCLAEAAPDGGSLDDLSNDEVAEQNCLVSLDEQSNLGGESGACGGGYTGDHRIFVTDGSCVQTVCAEECAGLEEDEVSVEVTDPVHDP